MAVTDAEIFGRYKVLRPRRLKSPHAQATRSALDIDFTELDPGDYVVHLQHGIGRYLGLLHLDLGEGETEFLHLEYAEGDKLYVPVQKVQSSPKSPQGIHAGASRRTACASRFHGSEQLTLMGVG